MRSQLAASLAILSDLTNKNNDLFSVVEDMSLFALCVTNMRSFTIVEAATQINQFYSFSIPISVIKTGIKRLHKKNAINSSNNIHYNIETVFLESLSEIRDKLNSISLLYKDTIRELVEFVKEKIHYENWNDEFIVEIEKNFNDIVIENGIQAKFSTEILNFLVLRKNNTEFVSLLNNIKYGYVVYSGICSVRDLNALGTFNYNLTLILSTDVIFSLHGLNGKFKKDIFDEFYGIISDINTANKDRNRRERIILAYLQETKHEIENFYYSAEEIVSGRGILTPTKTAMVNIVNGCSSRIDVLEKKEALFNYISSLNISLISSPTDSQNYIVESQDVINNFLEETLQNKENENDDILRILSIFTTINALRRGNNRGRAETSKYLYVAEKKLVFDLARSMNIKFDEHDAYFATNLDYIINRLWFIHNKGFSVSKRSASFDTIVRAQLALSSKLSDKIFETYKILLDRLNSGIMDKHSAESIYANLVSRCYNAEEITETNVDIVVQSINFSSLDDLINEQNAIQKEAKESLRAKEKICELYSDELKNRRKAYRTKAQCFYCFMSCIFFAFSAFLIFLWYSFFFIGTPSPNLASFVINMLAGAVLGCGGIWAYLKSVRKWVKRKVLATYKKDILKLKDKLLPKYQLSSS